MPRERDAILDMINEGSPTSGTLRARQSKFERVAEVLRGAAAPEIGSVPVNREVVQVRTTSEGRITRR